MKHSTRYWTSPRTSTPIVLYGMQYRSRTGGERERAASVVGWILDLHSVSSRTMHRGPFCLSVNTEGIDGRRRVAGRLPMASSPLLPTGSVRFPAARGIDTSIIDVNRSRVSTSLRRFRPFGSYLCSCLHSFSLLPVCPPSSPVLFLVFSRCSPLVFFKNKKEETERERKRG